MLTYLCLCRLQCPAASLMIQRFYAADSFHCYYISSCSLIDALLTILFPALLKGAVLVKNLAAKEPSALGLDTYYKQYYLCLAAAAATIKW